MKNLIATFVFIAATFVVAQAQTSTPNFDQVTAAVTSTDRTPTTATTSPFGPTRMAEFPGGVEALKSYLKENTQYTDNALNQAIEGTVTVQFAVNADGTIGNATVKGAANEELAKNAMQTVKAMPTWTPALQNGRAVKTKMAVTINYNMQ
ncbi:MAG: TonB family protein [Bacteroidota bacterium]